MLYNHTVWGKRRTWFLRIGIHITQAAGTFFSAVPSWVALCIVPYLQDVHFRTIVLWSLEGPGNLKVYEGAWTRWGATGKSRSILASWCCRHKIRESWAGLKLYLGGRPPFLGRSWTHISDFISPGPKPGQGSGAPRISPGSRTECAWVPSHVACKVIVHQSSTAEPQPPTPPQLGIMAQGINISAMNS